MRYSKELLKELWNTLGDTSVDDEGRIEDDFLFFEVGVNREEIWKWFEEQGFDVVGHF